MFALRVFIIQEIPKGFQWHALLSSNRIWVNTVYAGCILSDRPVESKIYWFEEMLEGATFAIQWYMFNERAYDLPIKNLTTSTCYLGILVQNKLD